MSSRGLLQAFRFVYILSAFVHKLLSEALQPEYKLFQKGRISKATKHECLVLSSMHQVDSATSERLSVLVDWPLTLVTRLTGSLQPKGS